jgi:hypothetical protein
LPNRFGKGVKQKEKNVKQRGQDQQTRRSHRFSRHTLPENYVDYCDWLNKARISWSSHHQTTTERKCNAIDLSRQGPDRQITCLIKKPDPTCAARKALVILRRLLEDH